MNVMAVQNSRTEAIWSEPTFPECPFEQVWHVLPVPVRNPKPLATLTPVASPSVTSRLQSFASPIGERKNGVNESALVEIWQTD
jgi:hypothetical protein